MKRTAREIIVDEKLIDNKNINVKIGTVANRSYPETIYLYISFWTKPMGKHLLDPNIRSLFKSYLEKNYEPDSKLKNTLQSNKYFIYEKENIFINNIPDNFNYNNKFNFISIELYLHTLNIKKENNLPLNNKKDTELFNEAVKIANIIGNSNHLSNSKKFDISKKSK